MKFDIDSQAIKELAIRHGEKAAVAVCGLLLVLFLYGSVTHSVYERSPEDLDKLIQAGRKNLNNPDSWDAAEQGIQNKNYVAAIEPLEDPLDPADYRWPIPMHSPLAIGPQKASQPEFFPPEELLAVAGRASVRIKGMAAAAAAPQPEIRNVSNKRGDALDNVDVAPRRPAASREKAKGTRYVMVLGLVPLTRQEEEYEQALYTDEITPEYLDFTVQRAELQTNLEWSEWQELDKEAIVAQYREFAELVADIGNPVVHPALTIPLPALANDKRWARSNMTHPKLLDLEREYEAKQEEFARALAEVEQEEEAEPQQEFNWLGGLREDSGQLNRRVVRRRRNAPRGEIEEGQALRPPDEPEEFFLFRLLDLTAEVESVYKYRVKLTLRNPNAGKQPELVESPEFAIGTKRETPWSRESNPVKVPDDIKYYVQGPDRSRGQEQGARFLITRWMPKDGSSMVADFTVNPGEVIGGQTKKIEKAADGNPATAETAKTINFDTPHILVDHSGGAVGLELRDLELEEVVPVEVLLVDEAGELQVRNQIEDEVDLLRELIRLEQEDVATREVEEKADRNRSRYRRDLRESYERSRRGGQHERKSRRGGHH